MGCFWGLVDGLAMVVSGLGHGYNYNRYSMGAGLCEYRPVFFLAIWLSPVTLSGLFLGDGI